MEEGKGFDHQSRVDLMTTGAIGRLLPKLGEFLKHEHNLQTSMKGHIESLEIHLRRMENALPRAQQDQVDPQEHNHCVNELRELAYDTEDIVDDLMLWMDHLTLWMDEGKQEVTQPIISQDSFSRETLDNIKVHVENLAAWHAANFVPTTTTSTVESCLDDGFKQARHLVGNHKLKADLISRMSSSSQGCKIVTIFGAGGMGKTTLAKAVYENNEGNFQYKAFVSLGPHPDMKKTLRDVLIHVDKRRYSDLYMSILHEQQLIDELRYFLEDMRGYMAPEYINRGLGITIIEIVKRQRDYPDEARVSPDEARVSLTVIIGPVSTGSNLLQWCTAIELQLQQMVPAAIVESLSKLTTVEELVLISAGPGSSLLIAPGAFPKLRYMRMNSWPLYQPGAMPCLESVELSVHVCAFNDANFDYLDFYRLRLLTLLAKAHVAIICWGAKTEDARYVERTLRHVVQHHPNQPILVLERLGQCADDKQLEDSHSRGSGSTQRDVDDKQICHKLNYPRVAPEFMSLELLAKITKNFSKKRELGRGTFGTVYKGVLNGKNIAVKVLHSMSQRLDYEEEFMKEFENLRRLDHSNIVQLLGYCYEIKRVCIEYEGRSVLADKIYRALCFEYMCNGSLQQHLDGKVHRLSWRTCYKIIKGVCEGLQYLHEGSETPMYHLDLKPGNILLGKKMVPKIADFGLSKFVRDNDTQATLSFLGTKRYCPPEYIEQGYVSNKFDIFSLGVVMIEIIAGPEGYCKAAEMPSQEFINHVQQIWRERLEETYECCQVKRCIEIALECVSADRKQRPNIGDITSWLNELENNTERLARTSTSQSET